MSDCHKVITLIVVSFGVMLCSTFTNRGLFIEIWNRAISS